MEREQLVQAMTGGAAARRVEAAEAAQQRRESRESMSHESLDSVMGLGGGARRDSLLERIGAFGRTMGSPGATHI